MKVLAYASLHVHMYSYSTYFIFILIFIELSFEALASQFHAPIKYAKPASLFKT